MSHAAVTRKWWNLRRLDATLNLHLRNPRREKTEAKRRCTSANFSAALTARRSNPWKSCVNPPAAFLRSTLIREKQATSVLTTFYHEYHTCAFYVSRTRNIFPPSLFLSLSFPSSLSVSFCLLFFSFNWNRLENLICRNKTYKKTKFRFTKNSIKFR